MGQYVRKTEEFKNKILLLEDNLRIMDEIEIKLKREEECKQQLLRQNEDLNGTIQTLAMKAETASVKIATLEV